jgi:hypothetical protein
MKHAVALLALLALLIHPVRAQEPTTQPGKSEAAQVDPAAWAPADALLYIGVTNVQATWDDLKQTSSFASMQDEKLASEMPSLQMFGKLLDGVRGRLAELLNVEREQLKNPLGGALALFLEVPAGGKPGDAQLVLVAEITDAALLKQYYETALTRLKERGKHESVTAGEYTIDVVTGLANEGAAEAETADEDVPEMTSPEEMVQQALDDLFDPSALPESLAMARAGERLIVGASADQVRAVLKREKASETLAGSDDYKAMGRKFKPLGPIRFLLNVPRLIDLAKAEASESEAQSMRDWIQLLGADSLGSLLAHARIGAGAAEWKFEAFLMMRGERTGLAKILTMDNTATAPPPSLSADTAIGLVLNVNAAATLDEVERMLRQSDPQQADAFRSGLQVPLPTGETFDFRKNFIDHLRAPLSFSLAIAKPVSPANVNLLISINHNDEAALVRALGGPAFGGFQAREVRGRQVFDSPPMPPFLPPGMLAAAPTNDRLLIGNTSAVESALEAGTQPTLAESDNWRKLSRFLPEQAWLLVYLDQHRLLEAIAEVMEKGDELAAGGPSLGAMFLMGAAQSMSQDLSGGGAELQKMTKYATQSAVTISTRPDGLLITGVQLKP